MQPWSSPPRRSQRVAVRRGHIRRMVGPHSIGRDRLAGPDALSDASACIRADYWPHIVNEDFMLQFFTDLEFLLAEVSGTPERNLLCVYRNPPHPPPPCTGPVNFEFLGYDLVDVQASASALTNCGGFRTSSTGRTLVQRMADVTRPRASGSIRAARGYPEEHHANCHVWAMSRAVMP